MDKDGLTGDTLTTPTLDLPSTTHSSPVGDVVHPEGLIPGPTGVGMSYFEHLEFPLLSDVIKFSVYFPFNIYMVPEEP